MHFNRFCTPNYNGLHLFILITRGFTLKRFLSLNTTLYFCIVKDFYFSCYCFVLHFIPFNSLFTFAQKDKIKQQQENTQIYRNSESTYIYKTMYIISVELTKNIHGNNNNNNNIQLEIEW